MTSKKKLQVPWLPTPAWKDFPLTKGLGHHRIPVGIILAANKKLACVLDSNSLNYATVRLLNDDRNTEGEFEVKSSQPGRAGSFSVGSVSVPFLDCEYLKDKPGDSRTVSVSYPTESKILPIYRFGGDEKEFFKLWDTQNAEFAYVESDYFGLLIPKIDKEATRKLAGGKNLDDLIVFYDKILTTYSELIGLSYEETGTNQNVRNRFFLKADKNGFGLAYYDDPYTAVNAGSIESFWLDVDHTNWGALHEIGHGHELRNLSDESLSVVETWNNILAFFYQVIMLKDEMATKGTKQTSMIISDLLKLENEVKKWGLLEKLSFLVHMFHKAGHKSFARFNQRTRQEYAGNSYYASGTLLLEKLMHFFAIDFAIDVYPFMKLAKADIREDQLIEHYYVLSSVAYPLNYLISDTKKRNSVKHKLGLLFDTSLVTPSDLSSSNLKNVFVINIDDQIFGDLTGDKLKLMDGSRTVAEVKIAFKTILLKDIPIGVYKVFVEPTAKNIKFVFHDYYAVVRDGNADNSLNLKAKIMKIPYLLPDKILFAGVGDIHFASLSANPIKKLVNFKFFSKDPHIYFAKEKYASISVKNKNNVVIFSKTIDGDGKDIGSYDIRMDGELQIEIFHAETKNANRLKTDDPITDEIIDRDNKTNHFVLNEQGFQNKNKKTANDLLEKSFLKKLDFIASKIRNKISLYSRHYSQPKYNMLLAVEAFERLFKNGSIDKSLRDKYKDCLPPVSAAEI